MDHINSYDSFFEKKTDEYGYITLDFDDGQSIEVFPFETEEGEVLYEVSLSGSDPSIYEVAKLCNCKVVLAHIKSGTIWEDDTEIIKSTPQAIETLYEVSSYGAYWRCRSNYTVFSTVEEIKMYYLNYSRKKLSEIKLILPENLPFNSSQYINKIGDIIEHKIMNEWGEASLCNGHYDSNFQHVSAKKANCLS